MADPTLLQYPRALVALTVDVVGEAEPLDVVLVPRDVSVTRRSHTQADTAECEIDATAMPLDPRTVQGAILTVFMANVGAMEESGTPDGTWRNERTRRFIGTVDTVDADQSEQGDTVVLKARDLSASLRDTKNIPPAAVPKHTDTVERAIRRVLDAVPGAAPLRIVGAGRDRLLGNSTTPRARTGHVHLDNGMTAWGVVEYIAGMANLLVHVFGDELVLREGSAVYDTTADAAVRLVYGTPAGNLLRMKAEKRFQRQRRGVRVVAWDPIERRRVEADYPPDSEVPNRRAPPQGRSRARPQEPERDVFTVARVTSKAELERIARTVWNERSRREMEVEAETPWFTAEYLALYNGDRVRLQMNRALAAGLNADQPHATQVAMVRRRLGCDARTADLLVRQARTPGADMMYVRDVTLRWNPEGDTGVRMVLVNLIELEV
jgi:hypothetical protein